jgi:hypothetical protein
MSAPLENKQATNELNDQAINELVEPDTELFGFGAESADFRDVREFPRFPFRGRAGAVVLPCEPGGEPLECDVLTTDVSRGGLSLLSRKQLVPGQQIVLVLNDAHRLVEVCWCCRVWSGLYSAGCKFLNSAVEQPNADAN